MGSGDGEARSRRPKIWWALTVLTAVFVGLVWDLRSPEFDDSQRRTDAVVEGHSRVKYLFTASGDEEPSPDLEDRSQQLPAIGRRPARDLERKDVVEHDPPPESVVSLGGVGSGTPFKQGDRIRYRDIDQLEPFLPPEFWRHREHFFYEGMEMEIGPFFRDYGEPPVFEAATFMSPTSLGRDGSLVGYSGGRPFPGHVDCADPTAGLKIIWNLVKRWEGDGSDASYLFTYWELGERLPLHFGGTSKTIRLAHRPEPHYVATMGDIFKSEKRQAAFGFEVDAPFDARGIMAMTYRYKSADGPLETSKDDDTWVYLPDLRRVRRVSATQHTDAVAGTDFTFDDLRSFSGNPTHYDLRCLGEQRTLAPMNSSVLAYPYAEDHRFGPTGLSFVDDLWELRHAYVVRLVPKSDDHPYSYKELWIDGQTYEPLYGFA